MSSQTQTDPHEQVGELEELDFDKLVNPTLENIAHRMEGGSPHRPLKCNWKLKSTIGRSDGSTDGDEISLFIVVIKHLYICRFQIDLNEWHVFRCSPVNFANKYDDATDVRDPQTALEAVEWLVKISGKPRKVAALPKKTGETFDSGWERLESL